MIGTQFEPDTVLEGNFPVNEDGSVIFDINNMKFSSSFHVTMTAAADDVDTDVVYTAPYIGYYEAEQGLAENGTYLAGMLGGDTAKGSGSGITAVISKERTNSASDMYGGGFISVYTKGEGIEGTAYLVLTDGSSVIRKALSLGDTYEATVIHHAFSGTDVEVSLDLSELKAGTVYADSFRIASAFRPTWNVDSSNADLWTAYATGGSYVLGQDVVTVSNAGTSDGNIQNGSINGNGGTILRGTEMTGDAMLFHNNAVNWTYSNVTIDGNKDNVTRTDACLWFMNGADITFENAVIRNFRTSSKERMAVTFTGMVEEE